MRFTTHSDSAAQRIPEITDQIINADKAVRWGIPPHELGPFEISWTCSACEEISC